MVTIYVTVILATLFLAFTQTTAQQFPTLRDFIKKNEKVGVWVDNVAGIIDRKLRPIPKEDGSFGVFTPEEYAIERLKLPIFPPYLQAFRKQPTQINAANFLENDGKTYAELQQEQKQQKNGQLNHPVTRMTQEDLNGEGLYPAEDPFSAGRLYQ